MKMTFSVLVIILFIIIFSNNPSSAQTCTPEKATIFEYGFPKLKYCMENLGYNASVNKYNWKLTVYNTYDDITISLNFGLKDYGTTSTDKLGLYDIKPKSFRVSYQQLYDAIYPEFIWSGITVKQ